MPEPSLAEQIIAEHTLTIERFRESCLSTVEELADRTIEALRAGHKICFFGNGGSAADSQHLAAEFVVRFTRNRRGLPSIALTTDTSILTASANDYGFESVFARQVEALCTPGDLVVGISTSGSSGNVIAGLQRAQDLGITTVAFTGENPGACGELADLVLSVPSGVTARVQECHLLAGHLLCELTELAFAETESPICER